MSVDGYRDQVRLLLDILPLVMAEPVFARQIRVEVAARATGAGKGFDCRGLGGGARGVGFGLFLQGVSLGVLGMLAGDSEFGMEP